MLILWFLNPLPSAVSPLAIPASWRSSCRKQNLVTMAPHLPFGKGTPARAWEGCLELARVSCKVLDNSTTHLCQSSPPHPKNGMRSIYPLHILPLLKSSLCRMYCGLRIYPNIKPYPFPLPWLFWIFVPKEFYLEFNGPLLFLFPRNVEHPYLLCPFPFFFFHSFILPFNDLGLLLSSHSTSLETLVWW